VATPLTASHRSWRAKVFIATWLSYVGFYFCRKPFSAAKNAIGTDLHFDASALANIYSAYLIAYAAGQFVAARMGPKLGPRNNVLLGMGLSIGVTIAMGWTPSLPVLAALIGINGLAQATGWSGNVGTMAGWFHKHERGRVMGAWSTNFTVGSLASTFAMGAILKVADWRWCFYFGAITLAVIWIIFWLFQRNRPEDVGLSPVDDPVTEIDESKIVEPPAAPGLGLSRDAWTNLMLVAGFYFFIKFIRYLIWSWAAYFLSNNYGVSDSNAVFYSAAFDLAGIPGIYLTGYLSDKYFGSRRGEIALIMMIGMMIAAGLLLAFGGAGVGVFTALLALVGFMLFGPDALLTGAGAMDIGSRRAATFAAATISGFGSLGAAVQEIAVARVYEPGKDGLGLVFIMIFATAVMATLFCAALVWRNARGGKGI